MRPVERGACPKRADNITDKEYSPYYDAKDDLAEVIGDYCSFCETWGYFSSLAVEHVQAKKYIENGIEIYAHLEEDWNNFLLACVHCNSIKGTKNVILNDFHLPHLSNTYKCIDYGQGGLIVIPPGLDPQEIDKVENLVDLVGLNRRPGIMGYSSKDSRWRNRRVAWNLAEKYLVKYEGQQVDEETICDLAVQRGFWSVWMKVFSNHQSVKTSLIQAFKGTFRQCETTNLYRAL